MKHVRRSTAYSFLDIELFAVLAIVGCILSIPWVAGDFLSLQSSGMVIVVATPREGQTFAHGETISFDLTLRDSSGTTNTVLYFWKEGNSPEAVYQISVRQGFFSYDLETDTLEDGTYKWYAKATPPDEDEVYTPTYTLFVGEENPSSPDEEPRSSTSETDTGNEGTGPGGHQSNRIGEKTAFFFPLTSGEKTTMTFSNRESLHHIRSITIHAIDNLPAGNGFLIHQEFERYFELFPEAGIEEVIGVGFGKPVHPFFGTLPPDMELYKTIHVHTTEDWTNLSFYSTIEFGVPHAWLQKHGLQPQHVGVQIVDKKTHEWRWKRVALVRSTATESIYRVALQGLPPFVIGGNEESFYGQKIVRVSPV